jgi:alkylated DNA repair dioxygenase AlkB
MRLDLGARMKAVLKAPRLGHSVMLDASDVQFIPAWISLQEADALFSGLPERLALKQESIVVAGRTVLQPRLMLWMGDPDATYRYSGRTFVPVAWDERVIELRSRVERAAQACFNSVLINLYRNGQDSMGYHADDELELGPNPTIASFSLGATRRFLMKPRRKKLWFPREFALTHGSLLIMRGTTQKEFVHGVPKEPKVSGPRLNLTFRYVSRTSVGQGNVTELES